MTVYEVMTQEVQTVSPTTNVAEAAKIMSEARVGFLPVVIGPHVIGVVTDRDLALRVIARGLSATRTKISTVMTAETIYVYEDQSVEEAVDLMCQKRVSRLLVYNRRGMFTGLLSFADIATLAEPSQSESIAEALGESYWQRHLFATIQPKENIHEFLKVTGRKCCNIRTIVCQRITLHKLDKVTNRTGTQKRINYDSLPLSFEFSRPIVQQFSAVKHRSEISRKPIGCATAACYLSSTRSINAQDSLAAHIFSACHSQSRVPRMLARRNSVGMFS